MGGLKAFKRQTTVKKTLNMVLEDQDKLDAVIVIATDRSGVRTAYFSDASRNDKILMKEFLGACLLKDWIESMEEIE